MLTVSKELFIVLCKAERHPAKKTKAHEKHCDANDIRDVCVIYPHFSLDCFLTFGTIQLKRAHLTSHLRLKLSNQIFFVVIQVLIVLTHSSHSR